MLRSLQIGLTYTDAFFLDVGFLTDLFIEKSNDSYEYYAKVEEEIYYPTYYHAPCFDFKTMYGVSEKGRAIRLAIPLQKVGQTKTDLLHTRYQPLTQTTNHPPLFRAHFPPACSVALVLNKARL